MKAPSTKVKKSASEIPTSPNNPREIIAQKIFISKLLVAGMAGDQIKELAFKVAPFDIVPIKLCGSNGLCTMTLNRHIDFINDGKREKWGIPTPKPKLFLKV